METRVQWRIYIVQDFPKSPGNVHAQNSRYIPCSWFIFSRVWSNVSYTVPYTYYPSLVPRTAWVWGWCYPHSKKRNVAVTSLNVTTLISVFTVCTCMTPCSWPYKLLICLQGDWELQDQDIYIYRLVQRVVGPSSDSTINVTHNYYMLETTTKLSLHTISSSGVVVTLQRNFL